MANFWLGWTITEIYYLHLLIPGDPASIIYWNIRGWCEILIPNVIYFGTAADRFMNDERFTFPCPIQVMPRLWTGFFVPENEIWIEGINEYKAERRIVIRIEGLT